MYKQLWLTKQERTLGIVHIIAFVNRSIEYIYQQYPYSSFLLKTINVTIVKGALYSYLPGKTVYLRNHNV